MDEGLAYRSERLRHWNRVSETKPGSKASIYYHNLLRKYYRFLVPEGQRVLELGCGDGSLLNSLEPSYGVGVDFSDKMIREGLQKYPHLNFIKCDVHDLFLEETFDVVILSDLVNDLWDVQRVFEVARRHVHKRSFIVINFYNNMWRLPLALAKSLGWGADVLQQNWLDTEDISNLLGLTGFEKIKERSEILLPMDISFISVILNRFLVKFIPFKWLALTNIIVARPAQRGFKDEKASVSVIVPARNESGNIGRILLSIDVGVRDTEIIFVEGHSTDGTYDEIVSQVRRFPEKKCRVFRQEGKGKGDAVRLGFKKATGEILLILDADLTVPAGEIERFARALESGKGDFINGVRLVYPMENKAMRFFNMVGNKFFSLAFTYLLGQPIKDTLCGTKVLWKREYLLLARNRSYFGSFDPFGDFDLLFGASRLNLKIVDMPVRYKMRKYGSTNISRWKHGVVLLKMVLFAAKKIKFI